MILLRNVLFLYFFSSYYLYEFIIDIVINSIYIKKFLIKKINVIFIVYIVYIYKYIKLYSFICCYIVFKYMILIYR